MGISRDLIASLLPQDPLLERRQRDEVSLAVQDFLAAELRLAPWHIRFGLTALGLACATYCRLRLSGRRMGRVSPQECAAALDAWEALSGAPGRGFLRAVRTMTVLAYFDHPLVLAHLGAPAPLQRQAERREYRQRRISERRP